MAEISVYWNCNRSVDGVREPGCQATVRRSAVQLQQTRAARREHQRRAPGVNKAETVAAYRRGE